MSQQFSRALAAAAEYRNLVGLLQLVLAEQIERDIDELVGSWRDVHTFVWPQPIADAAGVPAVRRTISKEK